MRTTMARKFCPVLSLLLTMMSCGKKVTDNNLVKTAPTIQNTESSNLIVELNTSKPNSGKYEFSRHGIVTLPDRLKVKGGNLVGRTASLTMQVSEQDAMICDYTTSSIQPSEMDIDSCYDLEGNEFGNATNQPLPMGDGNTITIKLKGAPASTDILAYFTVDWK